MTVEQIINTDGETDRDIEQILAESTGVRESATSFLEAKKYKEKRMERLMIILLRSNIRGLPPFYISRRTRESGLEVMATIPFKDFSDKNPKPGFLVLSKYGFHALMDSKKKENPILNDLNVHWLQTPMMDNFLLGFLKGSNKSYSRKDLFKFCMSNQLEFYPLDPKEALKKFQEIYEIIREKLSEAVSYNQAVVQSAQVIGSLAGVEKRKNGK